jgi:hypothetical protein
MAPLFDRQAGLGAVEGLDLALLVHRQHHGMGRRIDIETDDLAELVGEGLIVGQLELAHTMRLQPVGAPDTLHRADAVAGRLGHGRRRPMRRLPGWIGARQGYDPIDHRLVQRRDTRRARLVAQQAVDAGLHEAFLPAPHHGLALAGLSHDRRRPQTVGGQQYDPVAPGVLLRAVAVGHHHLQAGTVGSVDCNDNPLAHPQHSHGSESMGILKRDSIVRLDPLGLLNCPFAACDFSDKVLPISITDGQPFGANFAIRTAEQRVFLYNPNLGIGPTHRRSGKETDVKERYGALQSVV